jgi:hypothetical protein
MAAAPYRHKKILITGECHGRAHIGHAGAAGDERGPFVDHAIPDLARLLISVIGGEEQLALQAGPQLPHRSFPEHGVSAGGRDRWYS